MKSRHRSREIALQILYQFDLMGVLTSSSMQTTIADLQYYFEHFKVPENLRQFIAELVSGTLSKLKQIDKMVEERANRWKISRMSAVDRSILRIAVYEMIFWKEAPPPVVINEAVELAKDFGTPESPAFINGILDTVMNQAKQTSTQ